jgi:hypothetical protein
MPNQKNAIDKPSLKLFQLLTFLQDKAFTNKYMEVTNLWFATMHQLIAGFLLVGPKLNPVRHIAHGIDRLSPKPS